MIGDIAIGAYRSAGTQGVQLRQEWGRRGGGAPWTRVFAQMHYG